MSLPRLFIREPLGEGSHVQLDGRQANYLGNVLRMTTGGELLVFDGASGEWLARIADAAKKRMTIAVERRTREPETIPDVWLAFAPVKRTQTDWLVEKATELGAARLIPVMTRRTVAERVKLERLESIAIEAAEQCGRSSPGRPSFSPDPKEVSRTRSGHSSGACRTASPSPLDRGSCALRPRRLRRSPPI